MYDANYAAINSGGAETSKGWKVPAPLRTWDYAHTCAKETVSPPSSLHEFGVAHARLIGYIRGRLLILTHIQSHLLKTCAPPGEQEIASVEFATLAGARGSPCSVSVSLQNACAFSLSLPLSRTDRHTDRDTSTENQAHVYTHKCKCVHSCKRVDAHASGVQSTQKTPAN